KIARAFECSDCVDRASTSRQRRPLRAHSFARNKPTGPAPTIKTSVSVVTEFLISHRRIEACHFLENSASTSNRGDIDKSSRGLHHEAPFLWRRSTLKARAQNAPILFWWHSHTPKVCSQGSTNKLPVFTLRRKDSLSDGFLSNLVAQNASELRRVADA